LSLSNSVLALNQRQDSFHLNGGGVFVTVPVYATKDFFTQAHIVKFINFQIPVRCELLFISLFFGLLDGSSLKTSFVLLLLLKRFLIAVKGKTAAVRN